MGAMVSTEVATEGEGSKQRQSVTAFRGSTWRSHARRPSLLLPYLTTLPGWPGCTAAHAIRLDMHYGWTCNMRVHGRPG